MSLQEDRQQDCMDSEQSLRELFPKRLRKALEHYGWSQPELAKRSGVSKIMIAQMLIGNRLPSYNTFKKLMNAFWYTPGDFFLGRTDTISLVQKPFFTLPI